MGEREDIAAVLVRMPADLLARIDAYRQAVRESKGWDIGRTQLMVRALRRGLDAIEQEDRQPEASLPPALLEAPSEAPSKVASAPPTPATLILPTPDTPLAEPRKALTADQIKVADFAAQYNKLSTRDLAQKLYVENVYRAKDRKTGEAKPINPGTLQRWLDDAREAGFL